MLSDSQKQKLKTEIEKPAYSGLTDDEITAALNLKNIPQYKAVEYSHVASYLTLKNKYLALMESIEDSARSFKLSMQTFATFDLNKPGVIDAVNNQLDAVIADGLIDATDKAVILSLADDEPISIADQLGLPNIKPGYISKARAI